MCVPQFATQRCNDIIDTVTYQLYTADSKWSKHQIVVCIHRTQQISLELRMVQPKRTDGERRVPLFPDPNDNFSYNFNYHLHAPPCLKCCFTSTETVGLSGTGAQDSHLDFHTAPELCHAPPTEKNNLSTKSHSLTQSIYQSGSQPIAPSVPNSFAAPAHPPLPAMIVLVSTVMVDWALKTRFLPFFLLLSFMVLYVHRNHKPY